MPNFFNLIQFVLENKQDKVFRGYDEAHIATFLYKHMQNGTLWYTTNEHDEITGMIAATPNVEDKILFIDENLSMNSTNLKAFARRAKKDFPDYKLEFYKNGVHHLDTNNKIYDKLCA